MMFSVCLQYFGAFYVVQCHHQLPLINSIVRAIQKT